ncbi:AzlD domain-containing protein [Rhodobacter sp. Har01]|uniref:AzlD domain-containing protein n=1 Tax=Rhodobacter sp. Har01 TaxID=2883999 RepID=UPI001D08E914|nr:AzlD domain-containing protein [Rhodobacter sp. Har01]MCB6178211.1 AzlD domain-containing protein [Rhodobacter sp. Har01]
MNLDLVVLAVLAGAANWGFRALPTLLMRREPHPGGMMARFLAATGPAAIATLVVASVLPQLHPVPRALIPLAAGAAATVLAFLPRRSVAAATLIGATVYGLAFGLLA